MAVWQARRDLAPDGTPPAPTAPGADSQQARFVDGKLVLGDAELSADDVRELLAAKAERALRATKIPASAEGYQPTLPANLKLPDGIAEVQIDSKDPAFLDLRNLAHARGWDQDTFSAVLAIHAAKTAQESALLQTAIQSEIAKLGPNGSQRIGAFTTWLRSAVGDDSARALSQMLVSARHVEALEKLASKYLSGGAANSSQAHREPAQGSGKVSDAEYNAMSPAQRWAYSRSFDQTKFK
jgi:hypothetical protein